MINPDASEEDKIKISGLIDSLNALEESIEPKLCTGVFYSVLTTR